MVPGRGLLPEMILKGPFDGDGGINASQHISEQSFALSKRIHFQMFLSFCLVEHPKI